jgi:hypothetical protein
VSSPILTIEISDWAGLPRASCPVCKRFHKVAPTVEEARKAVKAHMWVRHVEEVAAHREAQAAMKATLYDADGKLITRMPLPDDAAFEDLKTQLKET